MSTPAGWYTTASGEQRYWDGDRWTEQRAPEGPALPAVVPTQQGYAMQQGYAQPAYQVAPKSPALGLLASFFIPGLGSMLVGRAGVGITILLLYFVAVLFSFILIGLPFAFGIWIWGMVDGYTGAQRWNLQHGIIS